MSSIHTDLTPAEKLVGLPIAEVERSIVIATLKATKGNRTHTARILGISVRALRNKINLYVAAGIAVPNPEPEKSQAADDESG